MTEYPVVLHAGCKINLYLHVGPRLKNGYHNLETLFLPLEDPYDVLEVRTAPGTVHGKTRVTFIAASHHAANAPEIDPDENTLTRAAAWHQELTGYCPSLDILVRKNIPHGAGLGGGSADAAALLLWLREQAQLQGLAVPPRERFIREAAVIGADVPFFLLGEPALATGVGERLVPTANPHAGRFLLLLCPGIAVSTAWAFGALDAERAKKNADCGLTSGTSQAKSTLARTPGKGNDFESIVFTAYPELGRLHKALLQSGALEAQMSGTGSSLFAIYEEKKMVESTAKALARDGLNVYTSCLPGR